MYSADSDLVRSNSTSARTSIETKAEQVVVHVVLINEWMPPPKTSFSGYSAINVQGSNLLGVQGVPEDGTPNSCLHQYCWGTDFSAILYIRIRIKDSP